jgi:hypothetical protein
MAGRDNNNILLLLLYSPTVPSGLYKAALITSEHYYSSHYQHLCKHNEQEYKEAHWMVQYNSLGEYRWALCMGLVAMGSVLQKQVSSYNLMAQEPVSLALLGLYGQRYYWGVGLVGYMK